MAKEFVLGVDLDGVCGDHSSAFRRVVAEERGITVESLPEQTTWDYEEWEISDDEFDHLHRVAVLEHHMFRTMSVIPGCAETLWRLSDAGVWIRLITHRLFVNWGHAVAVADTVAWLDEAGIPYRDLCFLGQKPQVEAHAYIDDAPHNVDVLRGTGSTVVVFDQPYNRHVEGLRARSWPEIELLVVELMSGAGFAVQPPLELGDDATRRLQDRLRHRPRGR